VVMSLVAGCASKRAAETSSSPGVALDELAGLEQQLAMREAQLRAVGAGPGTTQAATSGSGRDGGVGAAKAANEREGLAPVGAEPASAPRPAESAPVAGAPPQMDAEGVDDATSRGGRCEQICEIAAAICALEGQICGLVARHADDERYRAACERAAGDCRFATEACHACP
jgi:hypothetical protein